MKFNKIIELNEILLLSNIATYGAPYLRGNASNVARYNALLGWFFP